MENTGSIRKDNGGICSVSGLEMYSKDSWTDIAVNDELYIDVKFIGERILYIKFRGDVSNTDIDRVFDLRERIINEKLSDNQNIVEIRDYQDIKGRPSRVARDKQTKYLLKEKNRLICFVVLNASWSLKNAYKLGTLLFPTPFPIKLYDDYESAIMASVSFVNGYTIKNNLNLQNFVANEDWVYRGKECFYVQKVVKNLIIYKEIRGKIYDHDFNQIIDCYSRIFSSGNMKKNNFYEITDSSMIESSSFRARRIFKKEVSGIHDKYGCHPAASYTIAENIRFGNSIESFKKIMPYENYFVSNCEEALQSIARARNIDNCIFR